ncbi:hypothetical protein BGZ65_009510, partial [Modicella reniformis]
MFLIIKRTSRKRTASSLSTALDIKKLTMRPSSPSTPTSSNIEIESVESTNNDLSQIPQPNDVGNNVTKHTPLQSSAGHSAHDQVHGIKSSSG